VEDCKASIAATVAKFGKLDILVNGAAGNFLCAPEDLSPNGFKTVMEIDTIGTFYMSRSAFEPLKNSSGIIINMSATLHYLATHYQIHASAAKAGVDSITRSLALEWGKYGIRVNGIAPGPIENTEGFSRLAGNSDEVTAKVSETIPLRRTGKTVDIALTALFLASPAASYISGQTIVVDGGSVLFSHPTIPEHMYKSIAASRSKL